MWIFAFETNAQGYHIEHFDEDDGFSQSLATHLVQDKTGIIWIATWDGLYRYDGYRFLNFKSRPGDNSPLTVNRIQWVGTLAGSGDIICKSADCFYTFEQQKGTFTLYKNRAKPKVHQFHVPHDLLKRIGSLPEYKDREVRIVFVDRQEGVWVDSHRGLERITWRQAPTMPEKTIHDREQVVRGLYEDRQHRLWIADKSGYVTIRDREGHSHYLSRHGKLSAKPVTFGYSVYSFLEDSRGRMWLGTKPDGLYLLTPSGNGYTVSRFRHDDSAPYSISSNSIYDIKEDPQHRILVATFEGGLNIVEENGNTPRFIHFGNLLKNYPKKALQSRCLIVERDGVVLIGTGNGLYTTHIGKDYTKTVFYSNQRRPGAKWSLSDNYLMNMLMTHRGGIFVATSGGGIDRITSKNLLSDTIHFRHYNTHSGLASDQCLSLVEDAEGMLWLTSEASLSCLNPATNVSTNYTKRFFKGGYVFTEAMPVMTADGQLVFGTTQGTLAFNPHRIQKSRFVPNIITIPSSDTITLLPGQSDFSLQYAAIDYNKNEDIVYAYRMDGIDSEWHYTKSRELNYVGLAPGDYTLHLRSTNGDGVWVDNKRTIVIHRQPTFSETRTAKVLFVILMMTLTIIVFETWRYISRLKRELKDLRLSSMKQIELLGARLKEMLSVAETPTVIHEPNAELTADDTAFAQRAKDIIRQNIANCDFSIKDFATEMGVSRTVLYARVRTIFDCSPNNLLLFYRMEHAKQLFDEQHSHIAGVAYACGFSDPKYFSRCFKKYTGATPSEYINSK